MLTILYVALYIHIYNSVYLDIESPLNDVCSYIYESEFLYYTELMGISWPICIIFNESLLIICVDNNEKSVF